MKRDVQRFEVLPIEQIYGQYTTLVIEINGKRRQIPCGLPCEAGDMIAVIPKDYQPHVWHRVSNPIEPHEAIPAERRVVLCWLADSYLPFCGYIRYSGGDPNCPYFVIYDGNERIGANVVAWCDCLPLDGPANVKTSTGMMRPRGFPERPATPDTINVGSGI